MTQPSEVIAPTTPAPPPATVQQLSVADVRAAVEQILKTDYEMTKEEIARLERLEQVQTIDNKWRVGDTVPGRDDLVVFALYVGDDNEHIADHMQGDVRVYALPTTVVQPDARDYRRYTGSVIVNKSMTHSLTFEAFIHEVAYEELTVADRLGLLDDEEEPETGS